MAGAILCWGGANRANAEEPESELIYTGEADDLVVRAREGVEVDSLERSSEILAKDLDTGLLTTLYTEYVSSAELESLAVDSIFPIPALFDTSASLLADGYYVEKITVTASLWDGVRAYDARHRTVRRFAVEDGLVRWLNASSWEDETTFEEDCGSKAGGLKRCHSGAVVRDDMMDPLRLDDGPATTGSAEHVPESTERE